LLLLPALALVVAFAFVMLAILRPPTRAAALTGFYLLAYANIVFVGQITNSFYQLNSSFLWMLLHAVLLAAAVLAWMRAGRPLLRAPWLDEEENFLPRGWISSLKQWPDVWVLGAGVGAAFLFSAFLIWILPPNNNDSLATHLSRVAYWMQRGSFFPWPTERVWQITYPVNMQLQMFWTVLFLGSDRIVEAVQWVGTLAGLPVVYGLARLLGAARAQALFAAFLWATFPEIILESTTTQNDLVAGTLFGAVIYLLFLGLARNDARTLVLSGLALGLAIGTKQTLFFLLPGLGIILLLALIQRRPAGLKNLLVWGASSLTAFVLVGLYMFVVNLVSFGHPLGIESAISAQTGGQTRQSLVDNLTFNSARLLYQSIDPSGLPDPLAGYSFKAKALVAGKAFDLIGFPIEAERAVAQNMKFILRHRHLMQEDVAWYGPLFAFLVLPALVYQLVVGIRKRDLLRVGIFLLAFSFLLINSALRPGWDPAQGRYFIPVVTTSAALVAFIARPGWRWAPLRWMIVLVALTITANTFLLNAGKPLTGQHSVWTTDWMTQQTQQSFYMRHPLRFIEAHVPADASIGLVTFDAHLEYPFFRSTYSRRMVPVFPPERIADTAWLKDQGIEYVLLVLSEAGPEAAIPDALQYVSELDRWRLYALRSR
jgi:4-amino-4-deoxy-L-arabinose transferase-like glycosyltransferase